MSKSKKRSKKVGQDQVPAGLCDDPVKRVVDLDVGLEVPLGKNFGLLLDLFLQSSQLDGRDAPGGLPDRQALQDVPNLVGIQHLLSRRRHDAGPHVRHENDEPLVRQPPQSFPDRGAADLQLLREEDLREALAGLELLGEDHVKELAVDCLGRRGIDFRVPHGGFLLKLSWTWYTVLS